MGLIQLEVLKRLIQDRFGVEVEFTPPQVLYQETVAAPVAGYGHYEPLRHYAEVNLLLEPGPRGKMCIRDRSWAGSDGWKRLSDLPAGRRRER